MDIPGGQVLAQVAVDVPQEDTSVLVSYPSLSVDANLVDLLYFHSEFEPMFLLSFPAIQGNNITINKQTSFL